MSGHQWYVACNNRKLGPFSFDDLQQRANIGQICASDMLLKYGAKKWVRVDSIIGLIPNHDSPTLPSAPKAIPVAVLAEPARPRGIKPCHRPWNPVVIALLGVLFSPIWAGIMAALNGRRLGLPSPYWRQFALGLDG